MEYYNEMDVSDIKDMWDSDSFVDPVYHDVFTCTKDEDWSNALYQKSNVILRDRLMTDAALGGPRPIKSEHSYSLITPSTSPPPSSATPGGNSHTPNPTSGASVDSNVAAFNSYIDFANGSQVFLDHKSLDIRGRIDDMEEECFPTIPISGASGRAGSSSLPLASSTIASLILKKNLVPEDNECLEIKGEPISAPASPCTPCQSNCDITDDKSTITIVSPENLFTTPLKAHFSHLSDSEDDDEEYYQSMEVEDLNVLCEDEEEEEEEEAILHASRQGLPPTPPSSASSDSEGTASASCSPERRDSQTSTQNIRGFLAPRLYVTNSTHTTRQPINTPLISCQPKGSTGELTLTEEEKRTLQAEGYPVPTKLPLTKQEEKSLKKIRRKIKNKISAQESRRKKKEYMDNLERRVSVLNNENTSYKTRLGILEEKNRELLKEVQRLQAILHS